MKTLAYISYISIAVGIVLLGVIAFELRGLSVQSPSKFGDTSIQTIYAPMNTTGVLCANNTSTVLVATTTSRGYLRLSNIGGGPTIYLGFGVPASRYNGVALVASSSIELNQSNMYGGAINCLTDGTAATTTIEEAK